MGIEKLAEQYVTAWNDRDVAGLMRLFHPQASYHDAFWGETCSGSDLGKYFATALAEDNGLYEQDGELITTPNGFVIRYRVYDRDRVDPRPLQGVGAEVITLSGNQIMTVSDYYCDTDPENLVEIAARSEAMHGRLNVVALGLSGRTSARIRRRLNELAGEMTVFRDPQLSVTRLAERASCSVMHLFHVLEEQMGTTFNRFANECRARYASRLLVDRPCGDLSLIAIADDAGFESIAALDEAFKATFGLTINQYVRRFGQSHS